MGELFLYVGYGSWIVRCIKGLLLVIYNLIFECNWRLLIYLLGVWFICIYGIIKFFFEFVIREEK